MGQVIGQHPLRELQGLLAGHRMHGASHRSAPSEGAAGSGGWPSYGAGHGSAPSEGAAGSGGWPSYGARHRSTCTL